MFQMVVAASAYIIASAAYTQRLHARFANKASKFAGCDTTVGARYQHPSVSCGRITYGIRDTTYQNEFCSDERGSRTTKMLTAQGGVQPRSGIVVNAFACMLMPNLT